MDIEQLRFPIGKFDQPTTITPDILNQWIFDISTFPPLSQFFRRVRRGELVRINNSSLRLWLMGRQHQDSIFYLISYDIICRFDEPVVDRFFHGLPSLTR